MDIHSDPAAGIVAEFIAWFGAHRAIIIVLLTSAIGAGLGAYAGAQAIISLQRRSEEQEIESVANTTIAVMIALLGKLINFKKDLAFPAGNDASSLNQALSSGTAGEISIKLELWPEYSFDLTIPRQQIFEYAAQDLDLIQLVRTLEFNLKDLEHLVRQRNTTILQMNAYQAANGSLPMERLHIYLKYASLIARNVDENLYFLDHAITKTRSVAQKVLPQSRHKNIADVGLAAEVLPLMPPQDLIKGWVK